MQVKDLIKFLEDVQKEKIDLVRKRKENINSRYILAKKDFVCIDNMQDFINTISDILIDLNALQDRIIIRNNK